MSKPPASKAPAEAPAETTRLEALSDGVFAVAITLLALELKVPPLAEIGPHATLAHALRDEWPNYLAYVLSFVTVLITWVNHHTVFRVIRRTDHTFLLLNGMLLLAITTIPFVTQLLATYLQHPDARTAMAAYSGVFLAMALSFNRMWAYATRGGRLLAPDADPRVVQGITAQFRLGPPVYVGLFALSFVSAPASLALSVLVAAFYALPGSLTQGRRRGVKAEREE